MTARLGLACAVAALALYWGGALPGVAWQDSGVHQFRITAGWPENPYGLALSHPLHYWIGRGAVRGLSGMEPARVLNLLSGVFGAIGVGLLAAVVYQATQRVMAALLAAGSLGVAHTWWQMSCITETYTLAGALMAVEWLLLVQYSRTRRPAWLIGVFAVNGLHVANHLLGTLTLVTYAALVVLELRRGNPAREGAQDGSEKHAHPQVSWFIVAIAGAAWLLCSSPYWVLVANHWLRTGDITATLYSAFFGRQYADEVLNVSLSAALLRNSAAVLLYNFPSLVVAVALYGMWAARRAGYPPELRLFRRVMIAQAIIIAAFVARYSIRDQYTFFVPVCAVVALWFGVGADRLLARFKTAAAQGTAALFLALNVAAAPAAYAVVPPIAAGRNWLAGRMRDVPFRDEYRHFLQPWKTHDRSAEEFADHLLRRTEPQDWILADLTAGYALAYRRQTAHSDVPAPIFAVDLCLNAPRPPLSLEELQRELRAGRYVMAVPSRALELFWTGICFDKSDETIWRAIPCDETRE